MRRLAILVCLFIVLFLGLVSANYLDSARTIAVMGISDIRLNVFLMFGFGVATLLFLAIYDVFAAFGSFRRRRELQKQIERLESELLEPKRKSPPPASY